MRAKLREIKQQLRERMHDPVPQTGQWLKRVKLIVQGHFNYYAVPGTSTVSAYSGIECSGIGGVHSAVEARNADHLVAYARLG
jgi:hypothetical protein